MRRDGGLERRDSVLSITPRRRVILLRSLVLIEDVLPVVVSSRRAHGLGGHHFFQLILPGIVSAATLRQLNMAVLLGIDRWGFCGNRWLTLRVNLRWEQAWRKLRDV